MRRVYLALMVIIASALMTAWRSPVYETSAYALIIGPGGDLLLMPGNNENAGNPAGPTLARSNTKLLEINNLVRLASADLSARFNLEPDDISRWSVQPVTFRDSSLGKPTPGRMYAQVITEGYAITLRTGDNLYLYHGAGASVVYIGPITGPVNLPDDTTVR